MLSTLSKIIEKVSLVQAKNHINKILTDKQFGFRENFSTLFPLMLTLDHIQIELNKKNHVILIALDLKKAFDVVNVKEE